jgi:hypothetical protein
MKPSRLAVPFVLAVSALQGCYTPQPTTLYRSENLPETHWYALEAGDSRIKVLPAALQNAVTQQRQEVAAEMADKGAVSTELSKKIADLDETCNGAYLVSFDAIATNPTPDLNGQFESWDRRRQNDSMVYNQNLRSLADEWSRFWLMERPGGTPYDTVNTTGRY